MSVASTTARVQLSTRYWRSGVVATAVELGAGLLFGPSAQAADRWGPGYAIPDSHGAPGASHLGAYGAGSFFGNVKGHAYCADPTLAGPVASGGYGPFTPFTHWTSKATGQAATQTEIARASYILSKYGDTTSDVQAAAVDAPVNTELNAGSSYALPGGARALQRLSYPVVPRTVRARAGTYLAEAARYAGPYRINIHPQGGFTPNHNTIIEIDVTSAAGYKVPGVKLDLEAKLGRLRASGSEFTNSRGVAYAHIDPATTGAITFSVRAENLPATSLLAQIPHNSRAQRLVVAGGSSSVQVEEHWKSGSTGGGIQITKTAMGTHKALAGVTFELKNKTGKVVAGFHLAPDQKVTLTDGKVLNVAVTDARIPAQPVSKPRKVTIPVLPQTGA